MKKCAKCGSEMKDEDVFCNNCGEPISGVRENNVMASGSLASSGSVMSTQMAYGVTGMGNNGLNPGAEEQNKADSSADNDSLKKEISKLKQQSNKQLIIMLVICAICFVFGVVGIVLALINSSNNDQVVTTYGANNSIDLSKYDSKTSYGGYEFLIPKDYNHGFVDENGVEFLAVTDNADYSALIFYGDDKRIDSIKNESSSIAEDFATKFGTKVIVSSKVVNGIEFVCFAAQGVGEKKNDVLVAFSAAESGYFQTTIITEDGVDGSQYLNNVSTVLKNARKNSDAMQPIVNTRIEDVEIPLLDDVLPNDEEVKNE